jgi:cellulose synthase/poly-beta-1,6-N-acetylglucosamine synthase-like glycosyltransferase
MADEVTIVVVALIGGEALDACLRAVRSQSANCLVVRRDGTIVDAEGRPVGVADRTDIPAKRRSAAELATTPLVALVEDTVLPGSGWVHTVADAFGRNDVVACGGPVIIAEDLPAQTRALTLSEYGRFNDRQAAGEVSALPGCNFAFRRDALLQAMRGAEGLVDIEVFRRLNQNGGTIVWAPAMAVTFARAFPQGARLKTRFDHGSITASLTATTPLRRISTAAKAVLLPAVLTARTLRQASPGDLRSVRTFGWLLLQHTAWAAGEFAGALMGRSRGVSQWR